MQNLQRKWKSLRNSYAREQTKRKTLKSGSGSKSWKTYVYYNQLSFLSTFVGNKQTTSNIDNGDEQEFIEAQPTSDSENNDHTNDSGDEYTYEDTITQARSSKRQKTQNSDSESQLFMSIQKSLDQRNQITKSMDDPDRLFLLSLIDDFKQIPADKKMQIKLKITQTISDANQHKNQTNPFSVGSLFDTQCQLNSSYNNVNTPNPNQHLAVMYQRPQAYDNFHRTYSVPTDQLLNTPTHSLCQNIPPRHHSELNVTESSSSSLASYISECRDIN